jgi:ribokinase
MNHAMPRIAVVGSTNVDLTFRVARLPRPGETVSGISLATGLGGKGSNQAALAARLGAEVFLFSAVGADPFGQQALTRCRELGVDTRHVRVVPESTGTAGILVDDHAHNVIIVVPGANASVSPADVQAGRDVVTSAAAVLAQLETPIDATLEAFRLARAAGVRTILNPAPARDVPDELLTLTDLCIPNETELEVLADHSADTLDDLVRAARRLRLRGSEVVIVTRGEAGALILDTQGETLIPSVRVQAVDPTAAGDAFIGSLAVFLADNVPLHRAVRRACAVAALTVTRPGAIDSFPPRQEIEAFLADHLIEDGPGREDQ